MIVRETKNTGLGVFATKDYRAGDIIETCQLILINPEDRAIIDKTSLFNYYFSWGKAKDMAAIALGNGSLYNHSYSPNAKYIKDFKERAVVFMAHTDIKIGDEIRVNYNGDSLDLRPLWFDVID
jgi:SET domain-containing protein